MTATGLVPKVALAMIGGMVPLLIVGQTALCVEHGEPPLT